MSQRRMYFNQETEAKFAAVINKKYFSTDNMPPCQEVEKGFILPVKKTDGNYYLGGVVDENKSFIETSKYLRKDMAGGVAGGYDFDKTEAEYKDVEVMYAGLIINHFGHFMLEGTSRLWYWVENRDKNLDVAFLMAKKQQVIPQFWEFLDLLGIAKEKVHIIRKPAQFKKVHVPYQSHILNVSYNEKFMVPFEYIRNLLPQRHKEKIYLSRTKFKKGTPCFGEQYIEEMFKKNGWTIVYPERLSLKEQIETIKNAEELAGVSGTAMHLSLFADKGSVVTILERTDMPESEQNLINEAFGAVSYNVAVNLNPFPVDHSVGPLLLGVSKELNAYCQDRGLKVNPKHVGYIQAKDSKKFICEYMRSYTQKDNNAYLATKYPMTAERLLLMASAFLPLKKALKQTIKYFKQRFKNKR